MSSAKSLYLDYGQFVFKKIGKYPFIEKIVAHLMVCSDGTLLAVDGYIFIPPDEWEILELRVCEIVNFGTTYKTPNIVSHGTCPNLGIS